MARLDIITTKNKKSSFFDRRKKIATLLESCLTHANVLSTSNLDVFSVILKTTYLSKHPIG
jgi:hypothetical protein